MEGEVTISFCDYAQKVAYSSVQEARKSLTGQLRSKRIRVYECTAYPEHFHLTKERANKLHEHRHA